VSGAPDDVTPMFPLGMVLLPGSAIPLHVFEPRYRQMVLDLLARDDPPRFGQVLITQGRDTGGDDRRADVGVLAEMASIRALEGGRYGFLAVGLRRVRVVEWLVDDPYPRARLEPWDDRPSSAGDVAERVDELHERILGVLALAQELEPLLEVPTEQQLPTDPSAASYALCSLAPIGQSDRLRLLAVDGPDERLAGLADALDDVEAMLRFRLS
jgi:Lon protease-like protein